VIWIKQ